MWEETQENYGKMRSFPSISPSQMPALGHGLQQRQTGLQKLLAACFLGQVTVTACTIFVAVSLTLLLRSEFDILLVESI